MTSRRRCLFARDKAQVCANSGKQDTSETGLSEAGGAGDKCRKEEGEILPLADMMVPTAAPKDRQAGGQPGSLSLLFSSQAPSSVASLLLCVSPSSLCQSSASSPLSVVVLGG